MLKEKIQELKDNIKVLFTLQDKNIEIKSDYDLIDYLCSTDHSERILIDLVEEGFNINSQNIYGNTILMLACQIENISVIKLLLELGADINLKNKAGSTAMGWVDGFNDNVEIIELLNNYGGKKNE